MSSPLRQGGKVCPVVHVQMRDVVPLSLFLHSPPPSRLKILAIPSPPSLSGPLALRLSLCLTSLHFYIPTHHFHLSFPRFCLLTFHLSAEQIPLQLPKLCQKTLFLIYIFLLQLSLLPAVSNSNIAGTEYTRQNISWTSAVAFEAFNWCFHSAAGGKKTVGWLRLDKDWGLFILYDVRNHVHNFLIKKSVVPPAATAPYVHTIWWTRKDGEYD